MAQAPDLQGWAMTGIDLPDEAATAALAARLARCARAGDVIALRGDLGAGKTTFARAFIRALGGHEEVPSPTFTLVQLYELEAATIWHFDLYRLQAPEEAWELGIEEALATGIVLIEWPERLGPLLPEHRLDITLAFDDRAAARCAVLAAGPGWAARLGGSAADA
ncbi:MAG: tRNA (adenosine(37)-N6)-threonylcarbamoyltransferase complex ATPase subunit type 1 TsaE [Stellaceae bacterium]